MSSSSVTLNDLDVKKLKVIWRVFDKLFEFKAIVPTTKTQTVEDLRGDRKVLASRNPKLRKHPLMTWGALSVATRKDVNTLLKICKSSTKLEVKE